MDLFLVSLQTKYSLGFFFKFFLFFSKGFATLRDVDDGSWYIQDFCAVLAENADKMEIEELLKMLHFTVSFRRSSSNEMQTPYFQDREFNKVLYFNPGCYEE